MHAGKHRPLRAGEPSAESAAQNRIPLPHQAGLGRPFAIAHGSNESETRFSLMCATTRSDTYLEVAAFFRVM